MSLDYKKGSTHVDIHSHDATDHESSPSESEVTGSMDFPSTKSMLPSPMGVRSRVRPNVSQNTSFAAV